MATNILNPFPHLVQKSAKKIDDVPQLAWRLISESLTKSLRETKDIHEVARYDVMFSNCDPCYTPIESWLMSSL